MAERRGEFRQRTYLGGLVAFNGRFSTLDCLVRNLSEGGAKLSFAARPLVPWEFDLAIRKSGVNHRVRLVWQAEREAGVEFMGIERALAPPPAPAPEPVQPPPAPEPVEAGRVISFEAARRRLRPR